MLNVTASPVVGTAFELYGGLFSHCSALPCAHFHANLRRHLAAPPARWPAAGSIATCPPTRPTSTWLREFLHNGLDHARAGRAGGVGIEFKVRQRPRCRSPRHWNDAVAEARRDDDRGGSFILVHLLAGRRRGRPAVGLRPALPGPATGKPPPARCRAARRPG